MHVRTVKQGNALNLRKCLFIDEANVDEYIIIIKWVIKSKTSVSCFV